MVRAAAQKNFASTDSAYHDNRLYDSPVWEGNRHPVRTGTSYRLAEKRGISLIVNPRTLPADITGQLLGFGWIEAYPQPHQFADNAKRFTDRALAWHKRFGGPKDHVVQRAIGRAIIASAQRVPRTPDEKHQGHEPCRIHPLCQPRSPRC